MVFSRSSCVLLLLLTSSSVAWAEEGSTGSLQTQSKAQPAPQGLAAAGTSLVARLKLAQGDLKAALAVCAEESQQLPEAAEPWLYRTELLIQLAQTDAGAKSNSPSKSWDEAEKAVLSATRLAKGGEQRLRAIYLLSLIRLGQARWDDASAALSSAREELNKLKQAGSTLGASWEPFVERKLEQLAARKQLQKLAAETKARALGPS